MHTPSERVCELWAALGILWEGHEWGPLRPPRIPEVPPMGSLATPQGSHGATPGIPRKNQGHPQGSLGCILIDHP